MRDIIAIITARGCSKRIPKKNIKSFFDKPMLSYAINACKEADVFSEIMVSTDDAEIAEVARRYGANVPFMRSEKTANDYAITYDVLEEVITMYIEMGKEFRHVCCVYPCVPFLTGSTLKEAYSQFISFDIDALLPVCKYPVPIEWAMKIENNILIPNDRDAQLIRSQDLTPKYFDVGMFYFCKMDVMLKEKTATPKNTLAYIMNENEIQDIDTIDDWNMAEIKYQILKEQIHG
jgi:N-acylneuraminate cytidylyltransferase